MLTMIKKLREFKRNERMSRAELEAFKLTKFRQLVRHANQHAPYYARLVKERSIDIDTCTPEQFPPLTKSLLMANFDDIVTDRRITKRAIADFLSHSIDPNDLFLDEYRVIHTSGSSGEVGYFLYSKDDWMRGGAQGMRRRTGAQPRRKKEFGRFRLAFYGAVGGHFAGVTMMSAATKGLSRLFVKAGLYEINSPLPQTLEQLNAFQPHYLAGYTNALKVLADKQRQGALRIAPILVNALGETMTMSDKAALEAAFHCEALSGYGSSEHLMMGMSTPAGDTMILQDDDLIYEIHEDHSFISNLFNFTVPLIRYRMSDILRPIAGNSSRPPYLEISSLVGRTEKVPLFINRDGVEDFISPHTINEIIVKGVTRFQLQLLGATQFRFMICLDMALDAAQRAAAVGAVERRLREILDQKLMHNVTFEVVVAADLPVNPRTRKFQLIVDAQAGAG